MVISQTGNWVPHTCRALEKSRITLPFLLLAFLSNNKHYARLHRFPSKDLKVLRIRD